MSVEISFLNAHPHHAPVLATAQATEWSHLYGPNDWNAQIALAEFAVQQSDGRLPTTLIALDDTTLLGSISLINDDLPGWEQLNPWLASFYVFPPYRRHGVGARLLKAAERLLQENGITRAYLFTETRAAYFAAHGWVHYAATRANGSAASIMARDLPSREVS